MKQRIMLNIKKNQKITNTIFFDYEINNADWSAYVIFYSYEGN